MKHCKRCKTDKQVEEFYKNNRTADGRHHSCKQCMNEIAKASREKKRKANPEYYKEQDRERNLRNFYGISIADYEEMYRKQEGSCAICGKHSSEAELGGRSRLFVDHDHDTGKVRSLLCKPCNIGLGEFKDNTQLLRAAINYLEVHNGNNSR